MSPRRSVADTRDTRRRIVDRTVRMTAHGGFEAVSLGRLANELSMSKAGVIGHFGTMEALHLEAVERSIEVFRREVWEPAGNAAPGLARLLEICDCWVDYLSGDSYVGGCFTSGEFHESAAVRTAVADALRSWDRVLQHEVRTAQDAGEIATDAAAADIALALSGIAAATGQSLRLGLDKQVAPRARRAMRRAIGAP